MRIHDLRRYDHPDLSDFAIHFVKRAWPLNDEVPQDLLGMSGPGRLFTGILQHGEIRAFRVFYGWDPVVCFTECTPAGIQTLVAEGRYAPWGVAFTKDFIFRQGGGPAFYVRADEWDPVSSLPTQLRARCTKFWPGMISEESEEQIPAGLSAVTEWTHEREWRILGSGTPPAFRFAASDVAFVVIGDWASANPDYPCVVIDGSTGNIEDPNRVWIR